MKYGMLLACSFLILLLVYQERYTISGLFCLLAWGIEELFE